MKKIAIVFLLFAVVLSCDPQVEEVIQGEDVVLEAGLTDYIELLKCLLGHEELNKMSLMYMKPLLQETIKNYLL